MAQGVFPSYAFDLEYFDEQAELIRPYLLVFHTERSELEMRDMRRGVPFLKKTGAHSITLDDLSPGNKIALNGRQYSVVGFGDAATARARGSSVETTAAFIGPASTQLLGVVLHDIYKKGGLLVRNLRMTRLPAVILGELGGGYSALSAGPVVALQLQGQGAVGAWAKLAPGALGSSTAADGVRETRVLFGGAKLPLTRASGQASLALVKPHAVKAGDAGLIIGTLAQTFEISGAVLVTFDQGKAEEFLEVYRYVAADFEASVKELMAGPSIAVEVVAPTQALRDACGPRDPIVARVVAPGSVRAKFGKSISQNAIHCTDLERDAGLELDYVFNLMDA